MNKKTKKMYARTSHSYWVGNSSDPLKKIGSWFGEEELTLVLKQPLIWTFQ